MVKQTYNVILVSDIGNGTNTSGDTFFYDWTQIPDVPYNVRFSFISGVANLVNTQVATLFVDLTQPNNRIAMAQNGTNIVYRGGFIGSLMYSGTGANCFLFADVNTNPPTFIKSRPRNNNFVVEIHQNIASLAGDFVPVPGAYTLILSFEEC